MEWFCLGKVRTFWETHKIWKNSHGFDKSADLLSKRQNHEEDFFKLCVSQKFRTFNNYFTYCDEGDAKDSKLLT